MIKIGDRYFNLKINRKNNRNIYLRVKGDTLEISCPRWVRKDEINSRHKKKEIEKKKDPVLFGLLAGSSKLYFIADFIDEYCDLTFDKLTEIVGKELVESKFLTENIK